MGTKNTPQVTAEQLADLRSRLPRGYTRKIVETLAKKPYNQEFTQQYVSSVINGKQFNLTILQVAVRLRDKHEKETAQLLKELRQ